MRASQRLDFFRHIGQAFGVESSATERINTLRRRVRELRDLNKFPENKEYYHPTRLNSSAALHQQEMTQTMEEATDLEQAERAAAEYHAAGELAVFSAMQLEVNHGTTRGRRLASDPDVSTQPSRAKKDVSSHSTTS